MKVPAYGLQEKNITPTPLRQNKLHFVYPEKSSDGFCGYLRTQTTAFLKVYSIISCISDRYGQLDSNLFDSQSSGLWYKLERQKKKSQ